ncbi:MAG: hypothetical protein H6709_07480 [Kofleriaceae bacterium]|nr:hypothetical protein [Kofleriaceae bacterium]MCB9571921.1 hypothetical protein [Kofleriaceae bacterium]
MISKTTLATTILMVKRDLRREKPRRERREINHEHRAISVVDDRVIDARGAGVAAIATRPVRARTLVTSRGARSRAGRDRTPPVRARAQGVIARRRCAPARRA